MDRAITSFRIAPVPPRDYTDFENSLISIIREYADGGNPDFGSLLIETVNLTEFQGNVLTACRRIAYGSVQTYSQLAERSGSPRAARAVGSVMKINPIPIIVPCHRVVAAGGIGQYSAADGVSMKRRLLRLEGLDVDALAPRIAKL